MAKRIDISEYHAQSLIPYLRGIKKHGDPESYWMARRIVRRWTEFPSMIGKPNAYSDGAAQVIKSRNIPLEKLLWAEYGDQCKKSGLDDGPGHSTGLLHHEHMIPVNQLVKELVDLSKYTTESIISLIRKRAQIAWILKSEQKELDKICRTGNRSPELLESLNIKLNIPIEYA
jgi:hypothetical protein